MTGGRRVCTRYKLFEKALYRRYRI